MAFIRRISGLAYFMVMLVAGAFFIAMSLDLMPCAFLTALAGYVRVDPMIKGYVLLTGTLILVSGVTVLVRSKRSGEKGKLITFQNPDGEVTVSISAIENYVKRAAKEVPGIEEAEPFVKAVRKGVSIKTLISISAGTNIPEVTENIQFTVRNRVRDMLGVEENVTVKVHVNKILREAGPQVDDSREDEGEKG